LSAVTRSNCFAPSPDLGTVYVPIGMGSGICGLIGPRDLLGLKTEIVGVVARNAPAMALSFAAGKPVPTNSAQTFADGMATRACKSARAWPERGLP
jgi:threonine dehydratase